MTTNVRTLKNKIKKLLAEQHLAVFATQGDGYPYNTLVGYVVTSDLKFLLVATMRHTRKYRNLVRNPQVSLLIDSRTNYVSDFKDAVALTVTGTIRKAAKSVKTKYKKMYLQRFPHLQEFIADPDTAILAVGVNRYTYVQRFQEVLELEMK